MKLNTISEAIEDLKNNKIIIVVDDENRENEGDFVFPAEIITPEVVNFMATNGRGLICVPLTSKRCERLDEPEVPCSRAGAWTIYSRDACGWSMDSGCNSMNGT